MTRKRLLHSNSFPGACASLSCPASLLTVPIRISVTNSVSCQQVCMVSFDSSTLGKELDCHVRLHVKKPSGSPRFVFVVLLCRSDFQLLLERSDCLGSQHCRNVLLERRSIQPRTIADVGECQRLDHFLGEWGHVTVECWLTSVLSSITFV